MGSSVETWKRAGAGVTASVLNDGIANFTPGISSRVGSTSTLAHAGLKNTCAQSEGLTITGTKTYDAFGLETATTGTWKTAFGYAGNFGYQQTDAGMKLLGHRYYDPESGRFLSRDPIKDGRNWYSYGAGLSGAPNVLDPSGLIDTGILGGAVSNHQRPGAGPWIVIGIHVDSGTSWLIKPGTSTAWGVDVDCVLLIDRKTGEVLMFKVANLSRVNIHSGQVVIGMGVIGAREVNGLADAKDSPGGTMGWNDVYNIARRNGTLPSFVKPPTRKTGPRYKPPVAPHRSGPGFIDQGPLGNSGSNTSPRFHFMRPSYE